MTTLSPAAWRGRGARSARLRRADLPTHDLTKGSSIDLASASGAVDTSRRRNDGKSSLERWKLPAETRIAERQFDEMRLRMTYEAIKVGVGVLTAFNATVVMSKTIGLFF